MLWPLCIVFLLAIFPFRYDKTAIVRMGLATAIGFSSFFLSKVNHRFPADSELGKAGWAEVEFSAISSSTTPFGPIWVYKGTLLSFFNERGELVAKNIPIRLSMSAAKTINRPLADQRYRFRSSLKENSPGKYGLKAPKANEWEPIGSVWNPMEWRFLAKSQLQTHIKESIQNYHVAAFLSGIATGEFDDLQLSSELGRFGLQHLMAISGLHFSILSSMIGFFLCLFLSIRQVAFGLILLLSAYFFFLGNSPSVFRAWISLTIALGGVLLERRSISINSLGFALLFISIWDPMMIYHIGFQFSFAITGSILIWYAPFDQLLQRIFMKRSLSKMREIGWVQQHAYCLLCLLRQTLALALAVNVVALPLTLYYFNKFPFMGLVYNLFFPFMVSFSLLLLLLACISSVLIPLLGLWIHHLNEHYTQFLLNFTFNLPKTFDTTFRMEISETALLSYLLVVFVVGICIKQSIATQDAAPEWMVR